MPRNGNSARSHRALQNDDILREIFEYLSAPLQVFPVRQSLSDRKALLAAARVCSSFSEHALDGLWRDLPSVLPILKILKTSLLQIDTSYDMREYILQGPVSAAEFRRFLSYSRRVRALREVQLHNEKISPSVFQLLSYLARGKPLFPSLRTLGWEQYHPCGTEVLAFLSPSLRTLSLTIGEPRNPEDMSTLGGIICNFACQISDLPLQSLMIDDLHISPLFIRTLAHFKHLRVLTIKRPIAVQELTLSLAGLEDLERLDITLDDSEVPPDDKPLACFNSMKNLSVYRGTASGLLHILRATSTSRSLHTCEIEMLPLPATSSATFQKALRVLSRSSLRTVLVNCEPTRGFPKFTQYRDMVYPLFKSRGLRDVSLSFDDPTICLADNDIKGMAEAWPKLVSLTLFQCGSDPPIASIFSLFAFASQCPDLESLVFSNTNFLPTCPDRLDDVPVMSHRLQCLELRSLWNSSPEAVQQSARFLHRVFPEMECICEDDGEQCGLSDVLEHFQAVRREQLERTGRCLIA
ncbi:hypothetical protein SCP_1001430 [Sparassis crispa]|uniref:F-box domain-containing protein n=1 Tax=Sparassis crispa TaxID=139825 RepID=A0A401GXL2_9APHY|nr:hypothetical protein SCP_1001430 [Sparassis crispa]GBE86899.1 hypothetical protein SCP_1001430 [Sparassis crispa]